MLRVSRLDALTGLPTHEALLDAIDAPTVAVFFDIDAFRIVTDEHGHLTSDDILARLGVWLAGQAQAFRVAGDEFVLLLPGSTLAEAQEIAKRMMMSVASLPLPHAITLSAVVFCMHRMERTAFRGLLDDFAEKLYRAELASGRDRSNIVVSE